MKGIAVIGSGIAGQLIALRLVNSGWPVTLFEKEKSFHKSCSFAAAGLLSPDCEIEHSSKCFREVGMEGLKSWPQILAQLCEPVDFHLTGSLVIAHSSDRQDYLRFKEKILPSTFENLDSTKLHQLEPEIDSRFAEGLYFPNEGYLDSRNLLSSLEKTLSQNGVRLVYGSEVSVKPFAIELRGETETFDWVIDCRGWGARESLNDLRAVRGELLWVQAPEVKLSRPIRLLHPQHAIYIVPRKNSQYIIGATSVESPDMGPVKVRSVLELLSSAFVVHSGFAEGRMIESVVHCRPSFPDNLPRIRHSDGLISVNGYFRNGFLLAPILSEWVKEFVSTQNIPNMAKEIFESHGSFN